MIKSTLNIKITIMKKYNCAIISLITFITAMFCCYMSNIDIFSRSQATGSAYAISLIISLLAYVCACIHKIINHG
jgi:hypothetical protein